LKIEATTRYWISVSLAITAVLLAVSAFLLWIIFPRGYFPSRVIWVEIHKWTGLTLSVGVLVHIALHWRWLLQMTRRYTDKLRNKSC